MKLCTKCTRTLDPSFFYKNKRNTDGLSYICKDCEKKKSKDRYVKNRESILLKGKKRRKTKEHKDWYLTYCNRNRSKLNAKSSLRRAQERKATPPWLSDEHKAHTKRTYDLRQIISDATGIEYHVDHIEPLNGENICGLHVPWNLRVIPAKENTRKRNKRILP